MYTAQDVYDEVCRLLLENGGLQFTYTEESFLRDLQNSLVEICQETGFANAFLSVVGVASVGTHDLPEIAVDVHEVMYSNQVLDEGNSFSTARGDSLVDSESGIPEEWHRDKLGPAQVRLVPAPARQGNQVLIAPFGGHGTIGEASSAVDFDLDAEEPLYGTISECGGDYYAEVTGPMYGVVGSMIASDKNITAVSTIVPSEDELALTSILELIPDSFSSYLKWFVLEKIWLTDGESKDNQRAAYAGIRKQELLGLVKAIMSEDAPAS